MNNQEHNKLTNNAMVTALALVSCFLWGTAVPVIKFGYGILCIDVADSSSQILFAGIRFTVAGLLVLLFGRLSADGRNGMKFDSTMVKPVIVLSIFQTIGQYVFFYIAAAHVSGVKGTIITGMGSFFTILVACLAFRQERLTFNKTLGCILGMSGVILINILGNEVDLGFHLLGEGFYTIAALSCALSAVFISIFSKKHNPVALSGYQFTLGGIVMAIGGLAFGGRITFTGLAGPLILLYLAMVSAVAYTLWSVLLKYNPVSKVAIFGFTTPIFGSILSAFILNEADHLYGFGTLLSLALVCIGIMIVNRPGKNNQ